MRQVLVTVGATGSGATPAGAAAFATLDFEERDAIRRCQEGEKDAFELLVRRHMRRAAAFALGWTGNREDALDLSQEAFVRAFRALGGFDLSRPFYPWFHQILRNLCFTQLSRAARTREVPLEDRLERLDEGAGAGGGVERSVCLSAVPDPEVALERAELRRMVWEAIRRLPTNDREILVLREFQELTYAEIAEVLEIPQGTVMSRLHGARARLRRQLEVEK